MSRDEITAKIKELENSFGSIEDYPEVVLSKYNSLLQSSGKLFGRVSTKYPTYYEMLKEKDNEIKENSQNIAQLIISLHLRDWRGALPFMGRTIQKINEVITIEETLDKNPPKDIVSKEKYDEAIIERDKQIAITDALSKAKFFPKPSITIHNICKRFHLVASQLQIRHDSRPSLSISDEYDVQDLMHALLNIDFDDIRPEEWTPSYAGRCARMDFLLKREKIVIETKIAKEYGDEKRIGDELIIDIERYKKHPDCQELICFVYDPENKIRNKSALNADLKREEDSLKVIVIVNPMGI